MRAFVINVPETVDARLSQIRREHITTELARAAIPYQFVAAVDGFRLSDEQRALIDQQAVAENSYWLRQGVVGASLSHAQAYREILESGDRAGLVLEDDVKLDGDFAALLNEVQETIGDNEVMLLYWRTWPGCQFSTRDVTVLPGGQKLMYPIDAHKLNCASAYVVTEKACHTLLDAVIPIRTGTDDWGRFHARGGFDRIRCAVPRVVGMETDFKSTVDYVDPSGGKGRILTFVAHKRIFPFYQLLGWRRARTENRMSAFTLVDEPSPFASSTRSHPDR